MHNFTPEDLVQFLYKETSPGKTAAIKAALETDYELREKLEVITSAQGRLEALTLSPSQKSIDNILSYAESKVDELSTQA
jgi:hypothetical protein